MMCPVVYALAAMRMTPLTVASVLVTVTISVAAQQMPSAPATNDPRVGLKPGLHDAGEAIKNLEKLASLPKPEGFFDAEHPSGAAAPPERPEGQAPRSTPS